MEAKVSASDQEFLESVRRQRAELRESMSALELAMAAAAARDHVRWGERVHVALVELSADLRAHIEFTEGDEGLRVEILATAPDQAGYAVRTVRRGGVQPGPESVSVVRCQGGGCSRDRRSPPTGGLGMGSL
jgi:hypothetical protein